MGQWQCNEPAAGEGVAGSITPGVCNLSRHEGCDSTLRFTAFFEV